MTRSIRVPRRRWRDAAGKLYRRELSSPGSKQDAYRRYTEFGGMIAANGEEEAAFPENARRMYWEQFSMESFSWKKQGRV